MLGWLAGAVYFTGTLYWVTHVMAMYGGMPTVAAVAIDALLIVYQATYVAIFGAIVARLTRLGGARLLLAAPLAWVALEYARAHFLSGFPWVLLGYSQVGVLPIAQLASVTGVFGLSLLVAAIGASLAFALVTAPSGRRAYLPFGVTLTAVLLIALAGGLRLRAGGLLESGEAVTVGVVQANVSLGEKSDAMASARSFRDYLARTRQLIGQGAQLVVWPESSTAFYFAEDRVLAEEIRAVARQGNAAILFGSDQIERDGTVRYYNSAYMVSQDGATAGVYQKMHLVPFGEYVPAKSLFFFMSRLVEAVSDFSAGTVPFLFPFGEHRLNTSICYEVVYPDLVRRFVGDGSELLTTITNDAWFGQTSAPHQHFAQAAMRAIENGRYLVRSANTGISGFVDPYGRVLAMSGLFEPAALIGQVRFLQSRTIYTQLGDVAAYAAVAATLLLLVAVKRRVQ